MEDCVVTTEIIGDKHHTIYSRNGVIVAECRTEYRDMMLVTERWYRNGIIHRDDGPAVIYYENGQKTYEFWIRDGIWHRDDGPTRVRYNKDKKIEEHWFRNGKQHREDGPAETHYTDGKITHELWFRDGKKHREGGPAEIIYEEGQKVREYWCRHGKLCLVGTLASIMYADINFRYYYDTGDKLTKNIDKFRDAVKGDAIQGALRPLPLPIRDAIAWHYCYQ